MVSVNALGFRPNPLSGNETTCVNISKIQTRQDNEKVLLEGRAALPTDRGVVPSPSRQPKKPMGLRGGRIWQLRCQMWRARGACGELAPLPSPSNETIQSKEYLYNHYIITFDEKTIPRLHPSTKCSRIPRARISFIISSSSGHAPSVTISFTCPSAAKR